MILLNYCFILFPFELPLRLLGDRLPLDDALGLGGADKLDGFEQPGCELVEILLVEEDLVPVVARPPVGVDELAALGDGDEVVVGAGGAHVEKIGATTCLHGL